MAEEKAGKTVLIVEDEQALANIIQRQVRNRGIETVTARSVDQAMDYLKELGKVDAIWLDHYLLGAENGLDMVAKLKADERYRDIPVFLVSNTATEDKINSYIELGVEKYYAKINHRLSEIVEAVVSSVLAK